MKVAFIRLSPQAGYYASLAKATDQGNRGGPYLNYRREWDSHALEGHWPNKQELTDALQEMGFQVVDQTADE